MATKSPLGQLINSARAPEKLSLQDIANRATNRGIDMSKQNVSRLANDYPLASISGAQIRGLSLALGISERRVAAAALAALGLELADETTPLRQAILDADDVGERTKRILLSIIADDDQPGATILALASSSKSAAQPKVSDADDTLSEAALVTTPGVDQEPGETEE
jgi:transcriptional regulator with XRE-family HTH domain